MILLLHLLGIDTQQSYFYDFWSGFATQLSVITAGVVYYKRHNCHVHLCPRIGKHQVGHYTVCSKHHPDVPKRVYFPHIIKTHKETKNVKWI